MDGSKLTGMMWFCDALCSNPEQYKEIFEFKFKNYSNNDKDLNNLYHIFLDALKKSKFINPKSKFLDVGLSFINQNEDKYKQNLGCSLCSCILQRRWHNDEMNAKKILNQKSMNKIFDKYSKYFEK